MGWGGSGLGGYMGTWWGSGLGGGRCKATPLGATAGRAPGARIGGVRPGVAGCCCAASLSKCYLWQAPLIVPWERGTTDLEPHNSSKWLLQ
jgi:hypothetical protein